MRLRPEQEGERGAEVVVGGDREGMRAAAALVTSSEPHPAHQRSGTCPGTRGNEGKQLLLAPKRAGNRPNSPKIDS